MDLDKLKEVWKENDNLVQPIVKEEKINKILSLKGKSALNRLIRLETIGLILLPILCVFPFIQNTILPAAAYPTSSMILFIGFCFAGVFWQVKKIALLRRIDPLGMDIISCSKNMLKYRIYIKNEIIVGLIWMIVFILSYILSFIPQIPSAKLNIFLCMIAGISILAIIAIIISYKLLYLKNIRTVEKLIKEVKDFEEGNNTL